MLDSDTSFVPDFQSPDALDLPAGAATPVADAATQPVPPRPVTPRRPLRLSSARAEEPVRLSPAVPDIFDGVFDEDRPATDPRLQRGRARAMALLAAQEQHLSPEERNLWHDDTGAATTTGTEPAPAPQTQPIQTGRRVRHLTAADLSPQITPRNMPAIAPQPDGMDDPLRTQLHEVRAALYDPLPEGEAPATATLPERLTAATFNLILLVVALPLGLALTALTFLRGEDLRLSAHAIAIAGMFAVVLNQPPFPLL